MSSFEDEFPKLKVRGYPLKLKGDYDMSKDVFGQFVSCAQVQKHCLDKQRVKEKLDYWIGNLDDDWVVRNIKKELGLEDE